MKRKNRLISALLFIALFLTVAFPVSAAEYTRSIAVGEQATLSPSPYAYQGSYVGLYYWKSSDPGVAKVISSNPSAVAKIVGVSQGTCYVSCENRSYKITVGSSASMTAKKVKLNKSSLTIREGKSKKLVCKVTPSSAKNTITWSSSNNRVATVSSSGKVKAKNPGTAVITAKASSGKKATCKVKVKSRK